MELLKSDQLKPGNCYQGYKKTGEPCNFIIRMKENDMVTIDFSRMLSFGITQSSNYYKWSPESDFRFVIISKYSFNRIFNAIVNKLI